MNQEQKEFKKVIKNRRRHEGKVQMVEDERRHQLNKRKRWN
jgi:hypothetical protein